MGDDDDDTDQAEYGPIANQSIPEVIIQGGPLEIRSDKTIPKTRKLFKRRGRNHKRFERNDWDGKFRVAQVKVFVSGIANPIFTSTEDASGQWVQDYAWLYISHRQDCCDRSFANWSRAVLMSEFG